MDTSHLLYASDLTDAERALLEPLLPAESPVGRPRLHSLRTILNALFYQLRTGGAWRSTVSQTSFARPPSSAGGLSASTNDDSPHERRMTRDLLVLGLRQHPASAGQPTTGSEHHSVGADP